MPENLRVITNNVPRDVIDGYQLNVDERGEFDYIDWPAVDNGTDSASFFRYKGDLYDLGDGFEVYRGPEPNPFAGWDGYQSDSFFSGLVVRYVDDFERIVVGRYLA